MNTGSQRRRAAKSVPALRTQLREAVRAQILDAAEELIAARGLHGAGLAQIARRAGVAVGTLYNYFADRDAMMRALFESRRATLRPMLAAAAAGAAELPFEPRLRQFTRGLLQAFDTHRRYLKVVIETEHSKAAPTPIATDIHNALAAIIAAGRAERALDPDRAELLPLVILGAVRALVLERVTKGGELAGDADALISIFLDGARR